MDDEEIESEIELHMSVLRGAASQEDYDRARAALLVLQEVLDQRQSDSDYRNFNLDVPK